MKKPMVYYKEFLMFYIVYLGCLEVVLFLLNKPETDNVFILIIGFLELLMFAGGIYAVSFIYGIYFQAKYNLKFSGILLLMGLLFIVGLFVFSPWWLNFFVHGDIMTLYYLLEQASLQVLSFFVGSIIVKIIGDFNQRKTMKLPN